MHALKNKFPTKLVFGWLLLLVGVLVSAGLLFVNFWVAFYVHFRFCGVGCSTLRLNTQDLILLVLPLVLFLMFLFPSVELIRKKAISYLKIKHCLAIFLGLLIALVCILSFWYRPITFEEAKETALNYYNHCCLKEHGPPKIFEVRIEDTSPNRIWYFKFNERPVPEVVVEERAGASELL